MVRRTFAILYLTFLFLSLSGMLFSAINFRSVSAQEISANSCTVEFILDGAIGPASLDLLDRAEKRATQNKCSSILMVLNTPGGSLQTTRLMVEKILNSEIPYLCLVAPAGGHAGSAGAILMQACHYAGAFETTNIGAATPVSGGGEEIAEDLRNKIINDTRSWVEGLAALRGRNTQFAREIVEEAKAVSAQEALKLKAIEWVGTSKESFLQSAQGRKVKVRGNKESAIGTGSVIQFEQDLRYRVMDFLTHPQFAYLLFMGSLALLYYELTHPGVVAPGVIGALGLVISLIALHMLNVAWGGVLLIVLGIGLMIAEAFVASFGILGIGGIIAFFLGSLFLFDPEVQGFQLPLMTIVPTTALMGALMLGIAYLAFSTRKRQKQSTFDVLVDRRGRVTEVDADGRSGLMEISGEVWRFISAVPVRMGEAVKVEKPQGLTLIVVKEEV